MTFNEIVELPYFFELGVSNYTEFLKTSYYRNHVFIPAVSFFFYIRVGISTILFFTDQYVAAILMLKIVMPGGQPKTQSLLNLLLELAFLAFQGQAMVSSVSPPSLLIQEKPHIAEKARLGRLIKQAWLKRVLLILIH